jgi:ABC-type sugar transport system substrate-binding protein
MRDGSRAARSCYCGASQFAEHPDLAGIYITTEASIPVIKAARDLNILEKLTIITTDLFPAIVQELRTSTVAATIYQRPRTQGRMAFRVLREFLTEGHCPSFQVTLAPHLVMRGNLEFFLSREAGENMPTKSNASRSATAELEERFG